MAGEKIPDSISINSKDQPPLVPENPQIGNRTTYKPEYAKIAFDTLANSNTAKNKSHLCAAFQCSKPTLLQWMKKHPEFNAAVTSGLEAGKSKWFSRIAENAFEPTATVNNGLIKLLSANVYGIKDEPAVQVNVENNVNLDPEKLMKEKGIPIPNIDIEDVEDEG